MYKEDTDHLIFQSRDHSNLSPDSNIVNSNWPGFPRKDIGFSSSSGQFLILAGILVGILNIKLAEIRKKNFWNVQI